MASAGVVFDGSPGTAAPPATLGPYTMTQFPADPTSLGTVLSSIPSPLGGSLGFIGDVKHYRVGSGWATWSHGYTGDIYYTRGATSLTLTMPPDTGAFYFYAEPNPFATFLITATADDGTTSGPIAVTGHSGAKYYGFYGTAGSNIVSIDVSSSVDFAVGEFGIESPPVDIPEFASVAIPVISIIGLMFLFQRRKGK
uniref:PEF-CTERM protein sorting domain-containing protein n=1 Tax=Candidatus Methanophaga sp. ANME-1 ERB7 TaxID=2759913 RepID=A0A7G9Z8J4_9EURY|nr:hypothetical protein DBGJEDGB_00010 [Methanosarcinales archaeon ANME-1 ERB7]